MQPRTLDESQLSRMVEHVSYEFARLVMPMYVPVPAVNEKPWLEQCVLESALVHVRNLSDFLTDERPRHPKRQDDVVADDYFDNHWSNRPSFIFGTDRDGHDKFVAEINKRMAHVTLQRIGIRPFRWTTLTREFHLIRTSFETFLIDLKNAHPKRRQRFDRQLEISLPGYEPPK